MDGLDRDGKSHLRWNRILSDGDEEIDSDNEDATDKINAKGERPSVSGSDAEGNNREDSVFSDIDLSWYPLWSQLKKTGSSCIVADILYHDLKKGATICEQQKTQSLALRWIIAIFSSSLRSISTHNLVLTTPSKRIVQFSSISSCMKLVTVARIQSDFASSFNFFSIFSISN